MENENKNKNKNKNKKIVFLQLVDGTPQDLQTLQRVLMTAAKDSNYGFIINQSNKIKSISIDELKELIKQIEDDDNIEA